jgi:UDP-N-acetylglucosamine--N-acetylmuramyl-(pentapeptide) pyrophosphoryl-undecaprenol N-acetylglucosamine transferase
VDAACAEGGSSSGAEGPAATFALVTGGGTAGHVLPALAVAEALVARGRDRSSILFVGSNRGVEAEMAPSAGFETVLLPGRGLVRGMDPSNLAAAGGLTIALRRSIGIVRARRPAVVVSVGGYAGFACAAAAALSRVPLVLVNTDAVAGASNRVVARFASCCAVAFEGTDLPRSVVTGAPVREEVARVSREEPARAVAKEALGIPRGRVVIGVFGGSLGSGRINESVLGLAGLWSDRSDLAIHHVVGRRDWGEMSQVLPRGDRDGLHYQAVAFEERMDLLYGAADVVVSRSGALTVAELAAVGLPSVLVPLPRAPRDHQTANSRALVGAGAAVLLADSDCTPSGLAGALGSLLTDESGRQAMGRAAAGVGRPGAAESVARLVEEAAGEGRASR